MGQDEFNKMLIRAIEDRVIIITTNSNGRVVIKNQWGRIING